MSETLRQWLVVPVTGVLCFAIGWVMQPGAPPPPLPADEAEAQLANDPRPPVPNHAQDAGVVRLASVTAPSTTTPTPEAPAPIEDLGPERFVMPPEMAMTEAENEPRSETFARPIEDVAEATLRPRLQAIRSDLQSFRCRSTTCVGEIRANDESTSVVRAWMMQACANQCRFGLTGASGDASHTIWLEFTGDRPQPVFDAVQGEQASTLARLTAANE